MDSLTPGTLLARRYRLLNRIGVGGMSVIWRAHDEMLDREVAVKVLASSLAADARFREWARAEARSAAALDHPAVTAVYDYGEAVNDDGTLSPYVVMELLDGEPLSARLTGGPLPWREAVEICAAVAGALAAAHRRGVVHRDITPDNIMLTDNGVKVLDFGIATRIGTPDDDEDGATFGTPAYVAPERLDGRKARPENDTYALGVVLYEMLTGRTPFPVETWEELAALPRTDPPRPSGVPGLPSSLADLCQRCLARDPQRRPTASQIARHLRRYQGGGVRQLRRRVAMLASTAAALGLGVFVGAVLLAPDAPPHQAAAEPEPSATPPPTPGPTPARPARQQASPSPQSPASSPPARDADTVAEPTTPTAPPSVEETLATVYQLIDDGQANNEIREDVARDLRQLLDNLQAGLERGTVDLATETANLREKVNARAEEGALSPESAAALDSALAQLAAV